MLELRGVSKRFAEVQAVDDASFDIAAGEFFTLLGPSGCGKTTLLRLIAGFIEPDAGSISIDGVDIGALAPELRPVHTVFQSYALFPHMSVASNVAFPLQMVKTPKADIRRRVAQALDDVGMGELAERRPHELSGGQRQRVAIARALVDRPRVLLLDEPLGALDAKLRIQMKQELVSLQRELGISFVYVTHDQGEALSLSRRIAVMRSGRIEQIDTPEQLYLKPARRFVADFIGQCNLRDARVVATDGEAMDVDMGALGCRRMPACPGARAGLGGAVALRPESIRLSPGSGRSGRPGRPGRISGAICERLYEGDVTYYALQLPDGSRLRAMQANEDPARLPPLALDAEVELEWPPDALHFIAD